MCSRDKTSSGLRASVSNTLSKANINNRLIYEEIIFFFKPYLLAIYGTRFFYFIILQAQQNMILVIVE